MDKPYLGLRPYTEEDQGCFFGRENDRRILTDKILSNRLTLLFAASGVGKSSLLRASVLPYLRHPQHKNLDAVYCNDWVVDPLQSLQQHTLDTLIHSGLLADDMTLEKAETNNLNEFFQFCALFTRQPLVIVLDQFEEFFLYNKHTTEFKDFIHQFSVAVSDPATPIAVVISMREDFAMELNHFKPRLSTLLFENFYRLERLTIENARQAVTEPVEQLGFHYEDDFVDELLNDFAIREVIGDRSKPLPELIDTIEPPYLQIVCSQLWELNKNNSDKTLKRNTYVKSGRAVGLLKSYLNSVVAHFSENEKKIASKAFDHLVSRYGTKVAYTAADLAPVVRIKEAKLEAVLKKLDKARILRSQSREGIVWYELHHDIFSKSVGRWNRKFKAKQRNKKTLLTVGAGLVGGFLLYAAYDYGINSVSHHLRLSAPSNDSDNEIEIYRGRYGTRDLFNLQSYVAQTGYQEEELEPDKVFSDRVVGKLKTLNLELIENLQRSVRFERYLQTGYFKKAEQLLDYYLTLKKYDKVRELAEQLSRYPSEESIHILLSLFRSTTDKGVQKFVIQKLASFSSPTTTKSLISELNKNANLSDLTISHILEVLGQLGHQEAVPILTDFMNHKNHVLQLAAFTALNKMNALDRNQIVKHLSEADQEGKISMINLLSESGTSDKTDNFRSVILAYLAPEHTFPVRSAALKALSNRQHEEVSTALLTLLDDDDNQLKIAVMKIIQKKRLSSANEKLVELLSDPDPEVRDNVFSALSRLGNKNTIPLLARKLDTLADNNTKISAIKIIGEIGGKDITEKLLNILNTENNNAVKIAIINALGKIGSEEIISPVAALLRSNDAAVRTAVEKALIKNIHPRATQELVKYFTVSTVEKLHLIGLFISKHETESLRAVLKLLGHSNYEVRFIVVQVLYNAKDKVSLGGRNIDIAAIADEMISLLNKPLWATRNNAMSAIADTDLFTDKKLDNTIKQKLVMKIRDQVTGETGNLKPRIDDRITEAQERRFMMNYHRSLGTLGEVDIIPELMTLKVKGEQLTGNKAMEALDKMQGVKVAESLLPFLDNNDPAYRNYAMELLTKKSQHFQREIPESFIYLLASHIKSNDPAIRSGIVSILNSINSNDEKRGEILASQLNLEEDSLILQNIVEALTKIKYKQANLEILPLLDNPSSNVRRTALHFLAQSDPAQQDMSVIDSKIQTLFNDPDQDVIYDAAFATAKLGQKNNNHEESLQKEINTLLREYLKSLSQNSSTRSATVNQNIYERTDELIKLLGSTADQESIESLRKHVSNKELQEHRNTIIEVLAANQDREAVDLFIDALYQNDFEEYLETLKRFNHPALLEKLSVRLQDTNPQIQQTTIKALGRLGDPRAVPILMEQLDHQYSYIQISAIYALGNIGDHHAVNKLLALLNKQKLDQGVRQATIKALGQIQNPAAITDLLNQLSTENSEIEQDAIINALGLIGSAISNEEAKQEISSTFVNLLDTNIDLALNASIIENLGRLKARESVPILLNKLHALNTPQQNISQQVQQQYIQKKRTFQQESTSENTDKQQTVLLRALGIIGDGKAIEGLEKFINSGTASLSLESEARLARAMINPNPVEPELFKQTENPATEQSSVLNIALTKMIHESDDEKVITTLRDIIQSKSQTKNRPAIAQILGRISTDWSLLILMALFDDKNPEVKLQALTEIKRFAFKTLAQLEPLLIHTDPEIRNTAMRALGKMSRLQDTNSQLSIEKLTNIASNETLAASDRAAAFSALTDNDNNILPANLLSILQTDHGDLSSSGYLYLLITNKQSSETLPFLKLRLKEIENQYSGYRKQRDSQNNTPLEYPHTPWQFNLAKTIASISPQDGVDMLTHNLARVRYGAAAGLQSLGQAKLLKELIPLYRKQNQPLTSHVAYRVIDEILLEIQRRNNPADLLELKPLLPTTKPKEGLRARLKWTIEQLESHQPLEKAVSG